MKVYIVYNRFYNISGIFEDKNDAIERLNDLKRSYIEQGYTLIHDYCNSIRFENNVNICIQEYNTIPKQN